MDILDRLLQDANITKGIVTDTVDKYWFVLFKKHENKSYLDFII